MVSSRAHRGLIASLSVARFSVRGTAPQPLGGRSLRASADGGESVRISWELRSRLTPSVRDFVRGSSTGLFSVAAFLRLSKGVEGLLLDLSEIVDDGAGLAH